MPPSPSPTLLVAALWGECLPLLQRMEHRRPVSGALVSGTLAGQPVHLLRCGVGRIRAAEATRRALAALSAGAVVSLGTCGALRDELRVGDLVTASEVLGWEGPAPRPIPGLPAVVVATVPRPVMDPTSRQRWAERGAAVCEMEAAGVAEAAGDLPFLALKVVSDLAGARPPRLSHLPRAVGKAHFQHRAYGLVRAQLEPALERWLAGWDD